MPVSTRINLPDLPFHILNRGNNKEPIFLDGSDYKYFLSLLLRFKKEYNPKIYHFCLMPNHIHLFLEPRVEGSLSKIMQKLTLTYAIYFNNKYGRVGHVWQGRFRSSLVDKENYFIYCGLYIELNPIRAGLVNKPEDWPWSSYNYYTSDKSDSNFNNLIDDDPYYLELGPDISSRINNYRFQVNRIMEEEAINNIRSQLDKGILGNLEFQEKFKGRYKFLNSSPRPRGRPKNPHKYLLIRHNKSETV